MDTLENLAKFLGMAVAELSRRIEARTRGVKRKDWHVQRQPPHEHGMNTTRTLNPGMDENELYQAWSEAKDPNEKRELLGSLHMSVKGHARGVVYSKYPEASHHLAEEIADDVILGISNFRGESKFSTYVHSVGENKTNEQLRKKVREKKLIGQSFEPEDDNDERHPAAESDLNQRIILHDLSKGLKPGEKALLKAIAEGRSTKEIADRLGISLHAAESRVRRLRAKLRKKYLDERRIRQASNK